MPPLVDMSRCDHCGNCVTICPTSVFSMKSGVLEVAAPEACVYCVECEEERGCHARAIVIVCPSRYDDLRRAKKVDWESLRQRGENRKCLPGENCFGSTVAGSSCLFREFALAFS
ncbi:MAG: 4Fe-4S binding protein [Armatimonadetes bacterium]|nr:4Fe-4S binding protein [Armatimonadota bacterium]